MAQSDKKLSLHRDASVIRRGDIFWIEPEALPDNVFGYPHPHVVIQDDLFNRSRVHSVVVCATTSNLNRASEPGNILLDLGEGGLTKQSVLVVSQISAVAKASLGEYIGSLSQLRVERILDGLRFQQAAFFGER